MKKLIFCLLPFLAACEKEMLVDDTRPDQRLNEVLEAYQNLLAGASHGWNGYLFAAGGGGFGFHLEFDDRNRVTMLADINEQTAGEAAESSYRLKAATMPSLYFDTYSYIHLLADPDPMVNGGTPGWGLYSDFEFAIEWASADTMMLRGNLLGSKLVLIKATEGDAEAYRSGYFNAFKEKVDDYRSENLFPYLMDNVGQTIAIGLNLMRKNVTMTYDSAGTVVNQAVGFAMGSGEELLLADTVAVGGVRFDRLAFGAEDALFAKLGEHDGELLFDAGGPIFTFEQLLGVQFERVVVPMEEPILGNGAEFDARREAFLAAARGQLVPGTTFPQLDLIIDKEEQTMQVIAHIVQDGYVFLAPYGLYYNKEGEDYRFVFEGPQNSNAEFLFSAMTPLLQGFTNGAIELDFATGDNELMAVGTNTANPGFKFFGRLE